MLLVRGEGAVALHEPPPRLRVGSTQVQHQQLGHATDRPTEDTSLIQS